MDASNAFNSLDHLSALHNIHRLCLSLATALINSYRAPTKLFVEGDVLYSSEGIYHSCYVHVRTCYWMKVNMFLSHPQLDVLYNPLLDDSVCACKSSKRGSFV